MGGWAKSGTGNSLFWVLHVGGVGGGHRFRTLRHFLIYYHIIILCMIYSLLIAHNLSDLVAKRRRGRTFPDFFSLWIALQPSGPSFFVCQCEATIHHCHHHHQHDHALILTCSQYMNKKTQYVSQKTPPSSIFWPNFTMKSKKKKHGEC